MGWMDGCFMFSLYACLFLFMVLFCSFGSRSEQPRALQLLIECKLMMSDVGGACSFIPELHVQGLNGKV